MDVSGAGNQHDCQTIFFIFFSAVPTVFQSDLVLLATHTVCLSLFRAAQFGFCFVRLMRFLFGGRCIITQTGTLTDGMRRPRVCICEFPFKQTKVASHFCP